jgi:hypothetical protein
MNKIRSIETKDKEIYDGADFNIRPPSFMDDNHNMPNFFGLFRKGKLAIAIHQNYIVSICYNNTFSRKTKKSFIDRLEPKEMSQWESLDDEGGDEKYYAQG